MTGPGGAFRGVGTHVAVGRSCVRSSGKSPSPAARRSPEPEGVSAAMESGPISPGRIAGERFWIPRNLLIPVRSLISGEASAAQRRQGWMGAWKLW